MTPWEHVRLTAGALKSWAVARLWAALLASLLWGLGLWLLHVPLAPLWAVLAFFLHLVPYLGPPLALLGPALSLVLTLPAEDLLLHVIWLLSLYLGILVLDELVLQPTLLRRKAKVPLWASLLAPIVLGLAIPGWGVLLAPPLLAVVWAYRARKGASE
jgi:predicted PurR-regulated permease PerM